MITGRSCNPLGMRSISEDSNPAEATSGLQARAQWTAAPSEMVPPLVGGTPRRRERGRLWGLLGEADTISRLCHQMPDPSLPLEVETDSQQQGRSKLSHHPDVTGCHTAPPLNT